ncbi:hypothetical protein [Actinosynnema sp. NPDC023587]|uniref:hypothetical protein n=1 Tax=Actinosynnema sp. NPDC023587 TaxID=3154695 RepID=UPI0033F4936E
MKELLTSDRVRVIPDRPGPSSDDQGDIASAVVSVLSEPWKWQVLELAATCGKCSPVIAPAVVTKCHGPWE